MFDLIYVDKIEHKELYQKLLKRFMKYNLEKESKPYSQISAEGTIYNFTFKTTLGSFFSGCFELDLSLKGRRQNVIRDIFISYWSTGTVLSHNCPWKNKYDRTKNIRYQIPNAYVNVVQTTDSKGKDNRSCIKIVPKSHQILYDKRLEEIVNYTKMIKHLSRITENHLFELPNSCNLWSQKISLKKLCSAYQQLQNEINMLNYSANEKNCIICGCLCKIFESVSWYIDSSDIDIINEDQKDSIESSNDIDSVRE